MYYADNYCVFTEDHKNYIVTGPCTITKEKHSVKIPKDALYKYRQGDLIQDAMPMVSREDREFLISGISPKGWKKIFKEEEL